MDPVRVLPRVHGGRDPHRAAVDRRNRWTADFAGAERPFTTEITEQTPEQRIAWTTVDVNSGHAGTVSFHHIDAENCRVHLDMRFDPEGFVEQAGDRLGVVSR